MTLEQFVEQLEQIHLDLDARLYVTVRDSDGTNKTYQVRSVIINDDDSEQSKIELLTSIMPTKIPTHG